MRKLNILLTILVVIVGLVYIAGKVYTSILVSNEPPTISCPSDTLEISVTASESEKLAGVTAADKEDGDLTSKIMIAGISKLISADTAKITYIVFDGDHNAAQVTRLIRYTDYSRPRFELSAPMVFTVGQNVTLEGKLKATDVIDGDLTESVRVSALDVSSSTAGNYTATVFVTNSMGDTAKVGIPVKMVEDPLETRFVKLSRYIEYIRVGDTFAPASYIDSGESDVQYSGEVDTSAQGTYYVTYTKTDSTSIITSVLTVVVE